jgi:hypothetical protein
MKLDINNYFLGVNNLPWWFQIIFPNFNLPGKSIIQKGFLCELLNNFLEYKKHVYYLLYKQMSIYSTMIKLTFWKAEFLK